MFVAQPMLKGTDAMTEQASTRAIADRVAKALAETAVARDERGSTPKLVRGLLRESRLIPHELGARGASWSEFGAVVWRLAQEDGSRHLLLARLRLFAVPEPWRPWFAQTASNTPTYYS